MQPPYSSPPIPTPDGRDYSPPVSTVRGDWASAPKIVKGWAYPLTWLGIIVLPFVMAALFFADSNSRLGAESGLERILLLGFYIVLFGFDIWLNRALKAGAPAAWPAQIAASCLGLLGFPLGTLIHGYVLSQWFKPETKAWFGRS